MVHWMTNPADLMLPPLTLLRVLSDGNTHSGRELASLLGVSRTAIWKQLAKLEPLGLELQSQTGKGYCLAGGLELLDEELIFANLVGGLSALIGNFHLLRLVDSTNAYLLRQEPAEGIEICLSEYQSAGRGRRGRQWVSPFASNIYLSLKFTVNGGIAALEGLSLAVGVAVAHALSDLGVLDVQLKWPNDLLWRGKKLGGILIEIAGDPSGICQAVVGLGLNLKATHAMEQLIDQPWVALDNVLESVPQRNRIVASLLNRLVPLLANYETQGFAPYHQAWECLNAHVGQPVSLSMGNRTCEGIVRGVDETGALLLETETGISTFHGGEVSLRSAV